METILIIEDDATMLRGLKDNFEFEGYIVKTATDGEKGLDAVFKIKPDLLILDLMLPKINGYEICQRVRKEKLDLPIIILTAKGQESDIVLGLNVGADDYVTKPFSLRELLARVHALLRRASPDGVAASLPDEIAFGEVTVDVKALRGKRCGEPFEMTPRELKVLALLFRERGNAVSRESILNEVWGIEYYGTTRTLDQLVVKLRQKIEAVPSEPRHLLTVHSLGYRLDC